MTAAIAPADGWFLVPPGVPCWGRTVMHTPDGATYTNVPPPEPAPAAPDLRTVGDRVAACEQELAALWDNAGHNEYKRIELERRVEALESIVAKLATNLTEALRYIEALADRSNAISEVCNAHTDLFHRMAGDGR